MNRPEIFYETSPVLGTPSRLRTLSPLPPVNPTPTLSPLSSLGAARYTPAPIQERPVDIEVPVYSSPLPISSGGVRVPGTVTVLGTVPTLQDLTMGAATPTIGLRSPPKNNSLSPVTPVASNTSRVSQSSSPLVRSSSTPGQVYTPSVTPAAAQWQAYDDSRLIGMASLTPGVRSRPPVTKETRETVTVQRQSLGANKTKYQQTTTVSDEPGPITDYDSVQSYIDALLQRYKMIDEENQRNRAHLDLISRIRPPRYKYRLNSSDLQPIFITFVYPDGDIVDKIFDLREPMDTVIQQICYDLKSNNQVSLVVRGEGGVQCPPELDIGTCGLSDGQVVDVQFVGIE